MPGTAAGTVCRKHAIVASATSSGDAWLLGHSLPGITMLGFSNMPSSSTRWSYSASNTRVQRRGR